MNDNDPRYPEAECHLARMAAAAESLSDTPDRSVGALVRLGRWRVLQQLSSPSRIAPPHRSLDEHMEEVRAGIRAIHRAFATIGRERA